MEEKKGYNVLKLVMHGSRCYVSTDYICGKPLVQWLKYHPEVSKAQVFTWIREILYNLECFHQCQGMPSYQYVNPYSMIVSEELKIYLLDPGGKGQEDLMHLMRRKMVREHFLSPENQFYQRANITEDIYGFGKTLQYLIAAVEIVPSLSRREEYKIQKIISKCLNQNSKKSYKTIREISLHFPKEIKNKTEKRVNIEKAAVWLLVFCVLIASNIFWIMQIKKKNVMAAELQEQPKVIETKVEVVEKELNKELQEALWDLALFYVLDYEANENNRELFVALDEEYMAEKYQKFETCLKDDYLTREEFWGFLQGIAEEEEFKKIKQDQEQEKIVEEEEICTEN